MRGTHQNLLVVESRRQAFPPRPCLTMVLRLNVFTVKPFTITESSWGRYQVSTQAAAKPQSVARTTLEG